MRGQVHFKKVKYMRRGKSIIGMLIGLFLAFVGSIIALLFGNIIDNMLNIISYIILIILSAITILLAIQNVTESNNGKKAKIIKSATYTIIIIGITLIILMFPEIRGRVFMLMKFLYLLILVTIVPFTINKMFN